MHPLFGNGPRGCWRGDSEARPFHKVELGIF